MLDIDVSDYVEPEVVTDKGPYDLTIISAAKKEADVKGVTKDILELVLRINDSGLRNPKPVRYSLWFPDSTDTEEQRQASLGKIVRFMKALGDTGGIDEVAAIGKTITAVLGVKADEQYGASNVIKRLVV